MLCLVDIQCSAAEKTAPKEAATSGGGGLRGGGGGRGSWLLCCSRCRRLCSGCCCSCGLCSSCCCSCRLCSGGDCGGWGCCGDRGGGGGVRGGCLSSRKEDPADEVEDGGGLGGGADAQDLLYLSLDDIDENVEQDRPDESPGEPVLLHEGALLLGREGRGQEGPGEHESCGEW